MKFIYKIFTGIFFFLIFFGIGFSWQDIKQGHLPSQETLAKLLTPAETDPKVTPTQLFKENYDRVFSRYHKPVSHDKLKYAAMSGLLSSVGDPYTIFLDPKTAKEFLQDTKGNLVGIGALLSSDRLGARIRKVYEGTPAKQSGIQNGDLITAVNGKSIEGEDIFKIVQKIRGEENTIVKLSILRGSSSKPLILSIKRKNFSVPTVDSKYDAENQIGYIAITSFLEPTARQFAQALQDFEKKPTQGLVIDLRWNPGGLLEIATQMLSKFIDHQLVVTMKVKGNHNITEYTKAGQVISKKYPIVILINEESASAAEIFAGVLRDAKLATLVGEHTYGKASVQQPIPLVDGSCAKITIARYLLPRGEDISRKVDQDMQYVSGGLKPEVEIPFEPGSDFEQGEFTKDSQLKKAIQVLKSKVGNQKNLISAP